MPASQIDILNLACTHLGERLVTSIDDPVEIASRTKAHWNFWRDAELRKHAWRFAIVRTSLTKDVIGPSWGFQSAFTLPGDCMRVVQINEIYPGVDLSDYRNSDTAEFRIEGGKILSNDSTIKLRYVTNAKPIGEWDAAFVMTFSWFVAMQLVERLTESTTKGERARRGYNEALSDARKVQAIESAPESLSDDTWVLGRLT